jgi:hypothetical protein
MSCKFLVPYIVPYDYQHCYITFTNITFASESFLIPFMRKCKWVASLQHPLCSAGWISLQLSALRYKGVFAITIITFTSYNFLKWCCWALLCACVNESPVLCRLQFRATARSSSGPSWQPRICPSRRPGLSWCRCRKWTPPCNQRW